MEVYNAWLMHAFVQFDQTEKCFEKHEDVVINKTDSFDLILHKFSPDAGCKEERLMLTVPKWNLDLEKRYRSHYFEPFVKALRNIDEKDLYEWIQNSFDWTKGNQIISRK